MYSKCVSMLRSGKKKRTWKKFLKMHKYQCNHAATVLQLLAFDIVWWKSEKYETREIYKSLFHVQVECTRTLKRTHTHTHSHGLTLCCTISALDLRPRRAGFIFLRMQNVLQYSNSDIILYSLVYFSSWWSYISRTLPHVHIDHTFRLWSTVCCRRGFFPPSSYLLCV